MNHVIGLSAIWMMILSAPATNARQSTTQQSGSKPWHVELHHQIAREPITFLSRETRLTGTLYYPGDQQRTPAVVVLHGASSPSQSLPLYEHLEQMLPPLGIAVLVFDRRSGAGASDLHTLAEDGVAARNALAADPHIDPSKIGYWGISQGGWLALVAASLDPKTAFVISVSGPMTTPAVQMNFAVENILRIHGYGDREIEIALHARRAVDDYLRGTGSRASAEQALGAARTQPWFPLIYLDSSLPNPATSTWLAQMTFDPATALDKVSAPVLMLYGQDDPWVPVSLSMERLQPMIKQRPNITAIVVSGADHMMMLGVEPKDQVDSKFFPKEAPNAPEYFAVMSAWLQEHGFTRR